MDEVAAADDQHTLFAERRKPLADLEMKRRRLGPINRELYHRNIGLGIHVPQDRPGPVVSTPTLLHVDWQWREQLLDAPGQLE